MQMSSKIKRAALLAAGLLAIASMAAPTDAITGTLKTVSEMTFDPEGFVHVADDGVARSYSADGIVLDYAPLNNAQLMKFAASLPPNLAGEKEHLEAVFAGVDGHAVKSHLQIFNPAAHLRPNTDEPADQSANAAVEVKRQLETDPKQNSGLPSCVGQGCGGKHHCPDPCNVCSGAAHFQDKWCHYIVD